MFRAALAFILLLATPALGSPVDGRRAVIIDGDTIAIGRERIRILNIDAPETRGARCERELVVGLRAKERLAQLLRAGPIEIDRDGRDRYRRTLARIVGPGGDVGAALVREGLALPWQPGSAAKAERLAHWCGASHIGAKPKRPWHPTLRRKVNGQIVRREDRHHGE